MRPLPRILIVLLGLLPLEAFASQDALEKATPPSIATLLKPKIYKQVIEERDIDTDATLQEQHYAFHVAMLVHASLERTRRILTDYSLYSKLISYVDRTDYSATTHVLDIQGGIWKWRLRSWVRFEQVSERWIRYRIIGGHFTGLEGAIYFESLGEKGTLVYFNGGQQADQWPPKFVITRGAEIVFGFTAKRMRNYLESNEDAKLVPQPAAPSAPGSGDQKNDGQIPQPRNRL